MQGLVSFFHEESSFFQELLCYLCVTLQMDIHHLLQVPFQNLGFNMNRHINKYNVQRFVQGLPVEEDVSECLKDLSLLTIVTSFVEVSEEDGQE